MNTHTHIPIGSTPKIALDNIPLSSRFNTEPKDSSDRYDKIIDLVKETSIAYEQNKKLKDLKELKELERGDIQPF